ncbi:cytochrome c oxidase, subunit VIa [Atractiella rhizophila]|nr:cytochrome c oxidase, subunit VIa [Atractiella rhizophila]
MFSQRALRIAARNSVTLRQVSQRRGIAAKSVEKAQNYLKNEEAISHHAEKTTDLWRKITFFVAIPSVALAWLNFERIEKEEHAHHAHLVELNGGEEPERIVYPYMNIRNKEFPWGNQSLFHNPKANIAAGDPE